MRRTTSNTRSAISSHIANTDQGAPTRCCEWYVKCNFAYGFRTLRVRGASRDPSAAAHAAIRLSFLARTAPSVPGELASHARYLFSAAGSALPRRSPVPPDNPQLGLFAAWTRTLGRRIYCADPSPETGAPLMAWGASGAPGRAAHPLVAVKGEVRWQTLPSTSGAVMRALAALFPLQRLFAVRLRRWWRPTRSARRVPGTNGPFG